MRYANITLIMMLFIASLTKGQDLRDYLDNRLDDPEAAIIHIEKTFRTPRVVNMHSVENPYPGELIFNIGHRFGKINSGVYDLFGLDQARMRLSFDYGINPWLGAGFGRSSFQKTYDVWIKGTFLRQNTTNRPISAALYLNASQNTLKYIYPEQYDNFTDRLSTGGSLIVSRKFSEVFSLQISPMWLTSNYLPEIQKGTDDFSLGVGSRIRLSPMLHLNLEYIAKIIDNEVYNQDVFSLGFDLETGGHVFQLFLSNTQGISDKIFIINTPESWSDGAVFFGFNITRVFYLK